MSTSTSTQNPFDTVGRLVDLTREAFESQVRLGADFAELAQHALKEGSDPFEAGRAYVESAWREAGAYWQAVADLNVQYATQVVKLGSVAAGLVLADVDAALTKQRATKAEAAGEETRAGRSQASRRKQS